MRSLPEFRLRRRGSTPTALLSAMAGTLCALWVCGCGKPGPGAPVFLNGDPAMGELSSELRMSSLDPEGETWESAPWSGTPWISYSPHTQIHIAHPLGRVPRLVLVYISFVDAGTTPALAAGDLARLIEVTENDVTLWNDTSGTYFARVVLY